MKPEIEIKKIRGVNVITFNSFPQYDLDNVYMWDQLQAEVEGWA